MDCACVSAKPATRNWSALSRAAAAGERFIAGSNLPGPYADLIRSAIRKFRAECPVTTSRAVAGARIRCGQSTGRTEGTCVTVLEATVRLVHSPPVRTLVVLGYPDVYQAGDHIPDILDVSSRSGWKGWIDVLVKDIKLKGKHPETLTFAGRAKDGCWSSSAARQGRGGRAGAHA